MTKVSEEQPQDTFSLFLRHMSMGDYPDVDTALDFVQDFGRRDRSAFEPFYGNVLPVDASTFGLAFSILGVGVAVNPGYHNATLSWTLLILGVALILVGAIRKRTSGADERQAGATLRALGEFLSIPIIAGCLLAIIVGGTSLIREWITRPTDLQVQVQQLAKSVHQLELRLSPSATPTP
jgi:hypothetical protein